MVTHRIGEADEYRCLLGGGVAVAGTGGGGSRALAGLGDAGAEEVSRAARVRRPEREASRRSASCSREPATVD